MKKIKLNYICFLNNSGYSFAAQNYIQALDRSNNYDIKITTMGENPSKNFLGKSKYDYFLNMMNKKDSEDRILIYHCIPSLQNKIPKRGRKNIGFATFETFQPPSSWISNLNDNDCIITPSCFDYKIFLHEGVKKTIYHIPHCLDLDLYNKNIKTNSQGKFTFLFLGTWKERKGYDILIEAWFNEFSYDDNVQLVIKTDSYKKSKSYIEKFKEERGIKQGFPAIKIEYKIYDEIELLNLIKSSDCLISPSLGEGFGYPGLQCMALGVPVIITNFSGCKDYANEKTAILIEPSGFLFKSNMDRIPQFLNKKWAFLSVKNVQKAMRGVLNNNYLVDEKKKNALEFVNKNFSYKEIEKKFTNMIREIYG